MTTETSRTGKRKAQLNSLFAIAATPALALFALTGCAAWLAQSDASFVKRGNQICELEKAQTQKKWTALSGKSADVTDDEKQNFVRDVFIPNIRRQVRRIGDLQIGVPAFSAVTKAELEAMSTAADSALATLQNDPALALAESSAEPIFAAMNTSAEALGLDQCTLASLP